MSGRAEVRWSRDGEHFVHATIDVPAFVRGLFAQHGDEIANLEVRRASLEDTYMALVYRQESGTGSAGRRRVRGGGRMNPALHAVRAGLRRGWTEFRHILVAPGEYIFDVFVAAVILIILYFLRDNAVDGTTLSLAALILPGVVGMLVAHNTAMAAAFVVASSARTEPCCGSRRRPTASSGTSQASSSGSR